MPIAAVAGIAVGALLIGLAVALLAAICYYRRKNRRRTREYVPEIQEPGTARPMGMAAGGMRQKGMGASASPLLAQPQQMAQGYSSSTHSNVSGYSGAGQPRHGVPTMIGMAGPGVDRDRDMRQVSPVPAYNPEFAQPTYYPKGNTFSGYHHPDTYVEHAGRERGEWHAR